MSSVLAVTHLLIALISGILGFGGMAGTSIETAQMLTVIFAGLGVMTFVRGRRDYLR